MRLRDEPVLRFRTGLYFPETDEIWMISMKVYEALHTGKARLPSISGQAAYSLFIVLHEAADGSLHLDRAEGSQLRFDEEGLGHRRNGAEGAMELLGEYMNGLFADDGFAPEKETDTHGEKVMRKRRREATEMRVSPTSRPELYHRLTQVLVEGRPHEKILRKTPTALGIVYDSA